MDASINFSKELKMKINTVNAIIVTAVMMMSLVLIVVTFYG